MSLLKNKNLQPALYALLIGLGMLIGRYVSKDALPLRGDANKINHVLKLVQDQYVDSLDGDELQEEVIRGVLSSLDPHSYYIKAEEVEQVNRDLVGSFVGIGIEFNVINDTPYIVRVMEDGPAAKAGVKPADRMLQADTFNLIGLTNPEIIAVLKGSQNSEVALLLKRPLAQKHETIKIKRNTVPLPSVNAYLMVDSVTGYVRVDRFSGNTNEEFAKALKSLREGSELSQIIVDLRNNPGGYLHVAIDMLDQFFDEKQLLSYTKGKASYKKNYYSKPGGLATDLKVICLVNRYSASASEIFSGAIQDYDRGLVVGEKTFGKGLVQETFELPDESQLRLTVSRYYIPSGRCIQKSYEEGIQNYYDEVNHRRDTTLGDKDSFYFETKGGRKVFGGGGIDPDILLSEPDNKGSWLNDKSFNQILMRFIDDEYAFITSQKAGSDLMLAESINAKALRLLNTDSGQSAQDLLLPVVRRFYGEQSYFEELTKRDSAIQKSIQYFDQIDKLLQK